MKIYGLLIIAIGMLFACKQTGDNTTEQSIDPALLDSLTGMYSAILPCSDCPGIQYYLVLRPDYEFETNVKYIGKSAQPEQFYGRWSLQTDDIIFLDKAKPEHQYFRIEGDKLRLLDEAGKMHSGPDSNRYVLIRLKDEPPASRETTMLESKRSRGFDFTAGSNAPIWSIDVDFDGFTKFKADTLSLITPSPRPVAGPDPAIKVYAVPTTLGELTMQVRQQPCRDKQTGKEQPYTVNVQLHETRYEGCGSLLTEFPPDTVQQK